MADELRWRKGPVPWVEDHYLVRRIPRYAMIMPYSIVRGSDVLRDDEWCLLSNVLDALERRGREDGTDG